MGDYGVSIDAIIDLEELTKGCMDDYTEVSNAYIENVLVESAEEGQGHISVVLAFAVLLNLKAMILVFVIYKMNDNKFCPRKNDPKRAQQYQTDLEMSETKSSSKKRHRNWSKVDLVQLKFCVKLGKRNQTMTLRLKTYW